MNRPVPLDVALRSARTALPATCPPVSDATGRALRRSWLPGLAAAGTVPPAFAQAVALDNASGILDVMGTRITAALQGWNTVMLQAANQLFWILGAISLVWLGIQLVLRRNGDIADVVGELLRFVMFFGLFKFFLDNGAAIPMAIVNGFSSLGQAAASETVGAANFLEVTLLIFNRAESALAASRELLPVRAVLVVLMAVVIVILGLLIGLNYILVKFGVHVLVYLGLIFLGFGGSRWTSDITIHYFRTVIAQGLKLMAMLGLMALGIALMREYYEQLGEGVITIKNGLAFLLITVMLLFFVVKVPDTIANVVMGPVANNGIGGHGMGSIIALAFAMSQSAQLLGRGGLSPGGGQPSGVGGGRGDGGGAGGLGGSGSNGAGDLDGGPGRGSIGASAGAAGLPRRSGAEDARVGLARTVTAAMGGAGAAASVGVVAAPAPDRADGPTPVSAQVHRTPAPDASGAVATSIPGSIAESASVSEADSGLVDTVAPGLSTFIGESSNLAGAATGAAATRPSSLSNVRADRALIDEGKGLRASGLEPYPQAELADFVKGR